MRVSNRSVAANVAADNASLWPQAAKFSSDGKSKTHRGSEVCLRCDRGSSD